jgi:hypothetical protein
MGDIVRIKRTDPQINKPFDYGIVVEPCEKAQLNIFPLIEVFMFRTKRIESLQRSLIEVVSPVTSNKKNI